MAESLSKISEKCKTCPKSDECSNKEMELCAVADLQQIMESASMPLIRERVKSPLSPFVYKDELEKELYKALSINHMQFGA